MAKRGRRRNDDDFFAMEVHRMMQAYDCGVRAACRKIANGAAAQQLLPRKGLKRWIRGSEWRGQNAGTLEQRYFRWLRREEERQKKLTIEIT